MDAIQAIRKLKFPALFLAAALSNTTTPTSVEAGISFIFKCKKVNSLQPELDALHNQKGLRLIEKFESQNSKSYLCLKNDNGKYRHFEYDRQDKWLCETTRNSLCPSDFAPTS